MDAFGKDGESGFLRGRLVHRLLQGLPALPLSEREAAGGRFLARAVWNLEQKAQRALWKDVEAILSNPDWAPLFGPEAEAEVSIAGAIGGRAVSGRIDRLWVGEKDVLIVDFKSNHRRDFSNIPALYLEQLAAYRALVGEIYADRRIRCALLWTDIPDFTPVPDADLDAVLERLKTNWS
ncbi:hypothetical protein FACS1894205_5490 [Alphaproteobacteria bacterium]|nr:hypothetical protein FACS1894205_5490 [Alphaproteobacteria bacterium]